MSERSTIWTIGHGTAEVNDLVRLLREHGIAVLGDVRSSPYSRHAPQTNREVLAAALPRQGIRYVFLGNKLGGQPSDASLLDADGKPDYAKIAASNQYHQGIDELLQLARQSPVCCLCSEEDSARCHRGLLIAETLADAGHEVLHIRHNGSVETHAQMQERRRGGQLALF
jgi:uncharacterized protein (DUF488 family)